MSQKRFQVSGTREQGKIGVAARRSIVSAGAKLLSRIIKGVGIAHPLRGRLRIAEALVPKGTVPIDTGGCGGGVHPQLNPGAGGISKEIAKAVSAPADYDLRKYKLSSYCRRGCRK